MKLYHSDMAEHPDINNFQVLSTEPTDFLPQSTLSSTLALQVDLDLPDLDKDPRDPGEDTLRFHVCKFDEDVGEVVEDVEVDQVLEYLRSLF